MTSGRAAGEWRRDGGGLRLASMAKPEKPVYGTRTRTPPWCGTDSDGEYITMGLSFLPD